MHFFGMKPMIQVFFLDIGYKISNNNKIYSLGKNYYGQFGYGTCNNIFTPKLINSLKNYDIKLFKYVDMIILNAQNN